MREKRIVLPLLALSVLFPGRAMAAPEDRAQRLFDTGIELKRHGRYSEACPMLEESRRLDPGIGTEYHLADCYEKQGKYASAWLLFHEIAKQAMVSKQAERQRAVEDRAREIEPRMSRLTVAVPVESDAAGLEITRDGDVLPREKWNTALPVDPGVHRVTASSGSRHWQKTVTIDARPRNDWVIVPPLPRAPGTDPRKKVGWGLTALGVMSLGASGALALDSMGGRSSTDVTAGTIATGAFVLGTVAASTGIYLLLTSSSSNRSVGSAQRSQPGM